MLSRDIFESLATRFLIFGLGAGGSILLTRSLGPEGRGLFLATTGLVALGIQFGTLGLSASNTYYLNRGLADGATLAGNALVLSAGLGLLLAAAGLSVAARIHGLWPGLGTPTLVAALGTLPFSLATLFGQNLLLAVGEIRFYNLVEIARNVGWIALVVIFAVGLRQGHRTALWLNLVATALAACAVWQRLRRHGLPIAFRWDSTVFKATLGYGLKAYGITLAGYLVLRLDLLLVQNWRGAVETGYYGVAVQLGDLLLAIPTTVAMVVFPKAVAQGEQAWPMVARLTRSTGAALLVLMGLGWILAPWGVRLLFGPAFAPAVPAFRWLLPGIWLLSMETILVQYLNGLGMPIVLLWGWLVTLILNLALNAWWVPRYGIQGAAWASSLAYGFIAVLIMVLVRAARPLPVLRQP